MQIQSEKYDAPIFYKECEENLEKKENPNCKNNFTKIDPNETVIENSFGKVLFWVLRVAGEALIHLFVNSAANSDDKDIKSSNNSDDKKSEENDSDDKKK